MVWWKTHWTVEPIPRLWKFTVTKFGGTAPASPTRTVILAGAGPPAEHWLVASVMATCALTIWLGVVSMNGKTAFAAKPDS